MNYKWTGVQPQNKRFRDDAHENVKVSKYQFGQILTPVFYLMGDYSACTTMINFGICSNAKPFMALASSDLSHHRSYNAANMEAFQVAKTVFLRIKYVNVFRMPF